MKLSKTLLAMSILVGVLVAPMSFMSPVKAVANVDILSHNGYLDSFGYYHVVGEVQNVGDQPVNFVKIEVVFYDSNNLEVASRFDLTMLYVLLAGRKSPFDIVLLDTTQSATVDHYELYVTFSQATSLPTNLVISTHSWYVDNDGNMHISGEIMNLGDNTATNVKLVATYYNKAGNVVAATSAYLDPIETNLDPGQTRPFDILLSWDRTPYVDSYELTAESVEYALISVEHGVIPEFSAWGWVLVLSAMLAIVAVAWIHAKPSKH